METAIQDVLNVIKYNELEDVVIAGHSFAGKVAAGVADRVPEKVKLLLYLDAFHPAKVRTPQGVFNPGEEFHPPPGSWTVPFTETIIDSIGKDVKGPDREWLLTKATPWPMKHATDPVTLSEKFDAVKSAYVFCGGGFGGDGDYLDDILAGKTGKLDGPYKVIESGHWPMVTKPAELVEEMLSLAQDSTP